MVRYFCNIIVIVFCIVGLYCVESVIHIILLIDGTPFVISESSRNEYHSYAYQCRNDVCRRG